jgi:succinate dehydrogenase/fumarate reductase cytochrome b subunit
MTSVWKRPEASRALLALMFAAAFLLNGGIGLWVNLNNAHPAVNAMSAVVFVFGLIALARAVQQALKLRGGER